MDEPFTLYIASPLYDYRLSYMIESARRQDFPTHAVRGKTRFREKKHCQAKI
jgi:hypothetical protein